MELDIREIKQACNYAYTYGHKPTVNIVRGLEKVVHADDVLAVVFGTDVNWASVQTVQTRYVHGVINAICYGTSPELHCRPLRELPLILQRKDAEGDTQAYRVIVRGTELAECSAQVLIKSLRSRAKSMFGKYRISDVEYAHYNTDIFYPAYYEYCTLTIPAEEWSFKQLSGEITDLTHIIN